MSDPLSSSPPPPTPPPAPGAGYDPSSQALSEAFRSSFQLVKLIMAGLVVLFVCSGVFVVEPNQVAVVLRLGQPRGVGQEQLLKPGWHWALPYPIDEKIRIPVGQSHTLISTTGWYATNPEMEAANTEPQAMGVLRPDSDGYTLTADGNIIHVRATIKYRITDPLRYTFGFTNTTEILTNVVNEAIFYSSARTRADAALYKDKTAFRDLVISRVKTQVEELQLGVTLEPSDVETKAPADVRIQFEAVNAAEQERSKKISDARGQGDELTRRAVGEAQAIMGGGVISSNRLVQAVSSFATSFNDQLPSYKANPQLFRERLLATRLLRSMTNNNVKFFIPERFDQLRLQLSREPEKREAKENP